MKISVKKLLLLLVLAFAIVLAFASNAALAANSVDLRVIGTITPSACDISVAGGGTFDLGSISSGDLAATTTSDLPEVGGQTLNIACTGATQVAFKAIDNRNDSGLTGSTTGYGLGVDSASNPIGYYRLEAVSASAVVDGATGIPKYSTTDGATWGTYGSGTYLVSKPPHIHALDLASASATTPPIPITNASVDLKVRPTINPINTLDTSTEISIDGSVTIELVYL